MREPRQFLRGAISFVIYFAGGNSCFRNAIRAWPLHRGTLPLVVDVKGCLRPGTTTGNAAVLARLETVLGLIGITRDKWNNSRNKSRDPFVYVNGVRPPFVLGEQGSTPFLCTSYKIHFVFFVSLSLGFRFLRSSSCFLLSFPFTFAHNFPSHISAWTVVRTVASLLPCVTLRTRADLPVVSRGWNRARIEFKMEFIRVTADIC